MGPPTLVSLLRLFTGTLLVIIAVACNPAPPGDEQATSTPTAGPTVPDQTADLQARLDSTPAGGTLRLRRGGRYVVNGILWIERRSELTIDGNGATLEVTEPCGLGCGPDGRGWRRTVWIRDSSDIEVRDLTILGPFGGGVLDPAYEGEHGFAVEGATDLVLRNVTVRRVGGDGFYIIQSRDSGARTHGVLIDGAEVGDVGRHGLAIIDGRDITMTRSTVDGVRSFVDIESHHLEERVTDVRITRNRIGETRNVFFAASGSGMVGRIAIRHNHAYAAPLQMGIGNRSGKPPRFDFDVSYNTSDVPLHLPYVNLVRVSGVDGFRFVGNVQPFESTQQVALRDYGSCNVFASDNRLIGAGRVFRGPGNCHWVARQNELS